MSPLHQLGRARWSLLIGMETVAEEAFDIGLTISEEVGCERLNNGFPIITHDQYTCNAAIHCCHMNEVILNRRGEEHGIPEVTS